MAIKIYALVSKAYKNTSVKLYSVLLFLLTSQAMQIILSENRIRGQAAGQKSESGLLT